VQEQEQQANREGQAAARHNEKAAERERELS
jgi:hypothetical protein